MSLTSLCAEISLPVDSGPCVHARGLPASHSAAMLARGLREHPVSNGLRHGVPKVSVAGAHACGEDFKASDTAT